MRRLLDPQERGRIAMRAVAAVAALTPDAMSRRLLDLYQSLLGVDEPGARKVAVSRRTHAPKSSR